MAASLHENAQKVTYLVRKYPEKTVSQIIELMPMPAVDINSGIWKAIELGYISDMDPETQKFTFLKQPEVWQFGKDVDDLAEKILFALGWLNSQKEEDMEEVYFGNWNAGKLAHDVMIATSVLIEGKKIATYEVDDGTEEEPNVYLFYTLYENAEQEWGRKQFKKDPGAEEPTESEIVSEEESEQQEEQETENNEEN